jgi:hypothetical protein
MARPSSYTPEIGARICEAVASSQDGLRKTLENDPELPELRTVQRWQQNNAQFCQMFALAKQQQLHNMAEDIVDISRDDSLEPNDKRIRVDTLKWLLSKLIPRTYGDKLDVTSGGETLQVPSHQIDARVQSIIMQAQARRLTGQELVATLPDEAKSLLE